MKQPSSILLLLLSPVTVAAVCELFDCSIPRSSSGHGSNANCSIKQFDKAFLHPVPRANSLPPLANGSLGSFLDATFTVENAANCLTMTASVTVKQRYELILMCNGSSLVYSKGFVLDGGCLRPYPDIDQMAFSVFRRERLKITASDNGLTVSNLNEKGKTVGFSKYSAGYQSTLPGTQICDCGFFEKITEKYDECLATKTYYRYSEYLTEKCLAYGIAIVFLLTFVVAVVVLKYWKFYASDSGTMHQ